MLELFQLLSKHDKLLEIGRLLVIAKPTVGDFHQLQYYDADVMDEVKGWFENDGKEDAAGGQSSGGKAV